MDLLRKTFQTPVVPWTRTIPGKKMPINAMIVPSMTDCPIDKAWSEDFISEPSDN